jgi:hypothetical protein
MGKFKVGDRVRAISARRLSVLSGKTEVGDCGTVVSAPREDWGRLRVDVDWDSGENTASACDALEPIDDRPELATWEAVREVCGWMPGMGVAHG